MEDKIRLGRMLVDSGLLSEEQLKMAVDFQKAVGGKLGAILVKLGFIEDQTLTNFIARAQTLPTANLDELVIPEILVRKIPRSLIERHHLVPIRFHDGVLTIATSDPYDYEAIEEVQLAVDHRVEMVLASRSQILRCIQGLFYKQESAPAVTEKSKDQLLKELQQDERLPTPPKVSKFRMHEALIPLLIEKGVISEADLARKAVELEGTRES